MTRRAIMTLQNKTERGQVYLAPTSPHFVLLFRALVHTRQIRQKAALIMQRVIRGGLARKKCREKLRRRNAVLLIQRVYRGYVVSVFPSPCSSFVAQLGYKATIGMNMWCDCVRRLNLSFVRTLHKKRTFPVLRTVSNSNHSVSLLGSGCCRPRAIRARLRFKTAKAISRLSCPRVCCPNQTPQRGTSLERSPNSGSTRSLTILSSIRLQ